MSRGKRKSLALDPLKPFPNPKWEAFCHAMARGEKQGDSARLAGFKGVGADSRGVELMRRPVIKRRIDFLKSTTSKIAIERVSLSKSEVLQGLRKIANIAVGNEQVPSKDGDMMVYAIDLSAGNGAYIALGKELGMFVERKILGIQDIRTASADDLYKILGEIDSAIEARQLTDGGNPQPIRSQSAGDPTTIPSGPTSNDQEDGS